MTDNSDEQDGREGGGRSHSQPATAPAAGAQPNRSRHSRNRFVVFLNFLVSSIVLVVLAAAVVFYLGQRSFEAPGPARTAETVMIPPDTGVRAIAERLELEGLITDARVFSLGVRAHGKDGRLKAGEYEVEAGASMHDIMDLLESGESIVHTLALPEGLTVEQVFERIAGKGELAGDIPGELPPEGSLAPDTVRFTRGESRTDIVAHLESLQRRIVEEVWENRAEGLPIDDIDEFVTLASIVEKETGQPEERARVAAVFLNRLEQGMRLQSDPTVIYGIFGGAGKPSDRPIYRSDLEEPTDYNTYVIEGLPPTPIANPGRAALEAVANPESTSELYFVADGTGGHAFAPTLDEHNENVARWRRIERERREAAAADEEEGDDAGEERETDGAEDDSGQGGDG